MRPVVPNTLRVGLVTVPEMMLDQPLGGAEAVAQDVALGLTTLGEVLVLHGFPKTKPPRRGLRKLAPRLWAFDAFRLMPDVVEGGVIHNRALREGAERLLRSCDVVVSFERTVACAAAGRRILVLGGVAYRHCEESIDSRLWDCLVAPSAFVAQFARSRARGSARRVVVIPNGLDGSVFRLQDGKRSEDLVFLVPARPDEGKGFNEAVDLAGLCRGSGLAVRVVGMQQRSFNDVGDFYSQLRARAGDVPLDLAHWVARSKMPDMYRAAWVTLCLGAVPEGFGLAAIESLACGTPVLARPIGALPSIVPPEHGLRFVDASALDRVAGSLSESVPRLRAEAITRGAPFVRSTYDIAQMRERYNALVLSVLATPGFPSEREQCHNA